jgi:hypothetical protein
LAKLLQDIWILTEHGITLFSRVFNPKLNEQLFGALMSALNAYAEKIVEGGISSFELSDVRFTIVKKKELLFIANSNKKIKDSKVIQELKSISDKFLEQYSEELKNWDGEISRFSNFEEKIEDSLEIVETFKKAFW